MVLRCGLTAFFLFTISVKVFADSTEPANELANMSLEDLLNTKVTSASGREQKLDDVANAMYVITKEDIERSGAREVADLLYRVPGLQVRQLNGHQYGVGIHESGNYLINNLLVLIDGAVIFNPLFSGVTWENIPVSLNEIERIEIIRGSPGVLYSSNAVNGVINIITKAADTDDNYVQQEGGTQSFRDSSIGVGGKIGTSGLALRAYLDNQFDQGFPKSTNGSFSDRYLSDRDGGRVDYTPSDHQRLSIIANNNQQNSNSPNYVTGIETKTPGETTSAIINYTDKVTDMYDYNFHFDHVEQLGTAFVSDDAIVHTTSVSTQHNFHYDLLGANVTSIGGELRYNALHVAEDNGIPFQGLVTNGQASQKVISFFAQDEYRPIDKLILTAGIREDSNSLVINEAPLYSPKVSALYHLTDNSSIWASSSKAYRTPSFLDHDLSLYTPYITYTGSTDLKPEENFTQEVGYRELFLDQKLRADANLFLTNVKDVIILEGDTGTTGNNGNLVTKGAELTLDYQYTNNLSFSMDYSYLYPHFKPETANTLYTLYYDQSASNNILGIGARFTKNKLKIDLYVKYFEGYTDPTIGPGAKVRGYYKTFMRVSYDFKTPSWSGKLDATVFLDVDDSFGARKIEQDDVDLNSSNFINGVYIKPEVTIGVKVNF
jgi:iron complex outermembrane recepter protein